MREVGVFHSLAWTLLLAVSLASDTEGRWPAFRGGVAAGVATGRDLPDVWSTTKNVVWKIDVPGRGWSSPVVWGDQIFLTSVIREGKEEEPAKGLYFGGNRTKPPEDLHRWMVYCIDGRSGKPLWEREVHRGKPDSPHHVKNTYASETAVTDGEHVYVYFGNLGLFCLDMTGKEVWSQKWGSFPTAFGWGTAASPILYRDRIYVVNDNEKSSFLCAIDKKTGKEVWKVRRAEKSNWATPFLWENEQRTELVTCGKKVRSYDLDGKLLWELGGMSSIVIPTPLAGHGLLFITSGYVMDQVRPLYAIRPGASGDITLPKGETSNGPVVWSQPKAGPYNPSPIFYGDYLYVLYDMGFFACYDARTGKEVYGKTRMGPGATRFTSSPWAYDGKIFCLSEDGDTFVIQAGPTYKLLGKNSLDEMCMATPAISGGSLLIRTLSKLYRIEKRGAAAPR
jgi:outer membrane protein assembly factor BamB